MVSRILFSFLVLSYSLVRAAEPSRESLEAVFEYFQPTAFNELLAKLEKDPQELSEVTTGIVDFLAQKPHWPRAYLRFEQLVRQFGQENRSTFVSLLENLNSRHHGRRRVAYFALAGLRDYMSAEAKAPFNTLLVPRATNPAFRNDYEAMIAFRTLVQVGYFKGFNPERTKLKRQALEMWGRRTVRIYNSGNLLAVLTLASSLEEASLVDSWTDHLLQTAEGNSFDRNGLFLRAIARGGKGKKHGNTPLIKLTLSHSALFETGRFYPQRELGSVAELHPKKKHLWYPYVQFAIERVQSKSIKIDEAEVHGIFLSRIASGLSQSKNDPQTNQRLGTQIKRALKEFLDSESAEGERARSSIEEAIELLNKGT